MDKPHALTPLAPKISDQDDAVNMIARIHSEVTGVSDGWICAGCGNRGPHEWCTNCHTNEQSRPYFSRLDNILPSGTESLLNAVMSTIKD